MTLLIGRLRERGVRVWLDGGEVRCRGPKKAFTPEVKAWLKEHKAAIARELSHPDKTAKTPVLEACYHLNFESLCVHCQEQMGLRELE